MNDLVREEHALAPLRTDKIQRSIPGKAQPPRLKIRFRQKSIEVIPHRHCGLLKHIFRVGQRMHYTIDVVEEHVPVLAQQPHEVVLATNYVKGVVGHSIVSSTKRSRPNDRLPFDWGENRPERQSPRAFSKTELAGDNNITPAPGRSL